MEKNLASLYDTAADNYMESNFDESPESSFYDEEFDMNTYDADAVQSYAGPDAMHYDGGPDHFGDADNLFGIAIGKKARRRKKLRNTRADVEYNRQLADLKLQQDAIDKSISPEAVALNNVQQSQPLVASYVTNAGQTPQQNPAALALQASTIFNDQIYAKQQEGVPDYDTAYDSVIQDQQEDWGTEEADQFFGELLSSVFEAGKTLLNKINDKREANGKKPLFAGKNWHKLAYKLSQNKGVLVDGLNSTEQLYLKATKKELQDSGNIKGETAVGAAFTAFKDDQTKQAIMKYLPYALIVLVLVFMAGKKL